MYKRRDWLFTHGADGGGSDSSSDDDSSSEEGARNEEGSRQHMRVSPRSLQACMHPAALVTSSQARPEASRKASRPRRSRRVSPGRTSGGWRQQAASPPPRPLPPLHRLSAPLSTALIAWLRGPATLLTGTFAACPAGEEAGGAAEGGAVGSGSGSGSDEEDSKFSGELYDAEGADVGGSGSDGGGPPLDDVMGARRLEDFSGEPAGGRGRAPPLLLLPPPAACKEGGPEPLLPQGARSARSESRQRADSQ